MTHDKLCYVAINGGNCCPWLPECDCQCMCDFIKEIRDDTLAALTGLEWYSKARWTGYYEGIDAAEAAVTLDVVNRGLDAYDDEFLSRSCPHPDGSDSVCYECNKERVVQEIKAAIRALKEKA